MINSKGSVVVSDKRTPYGLAGLIVVPDGRGHSQNPLYEARNNSSWCASPVWKNCERYPNTHLQFVNLAFLALLLRKL
jgi:hypothetical protein